MNSAVDKHLLPIKEWVDEQYDEGRVTTITDNELVVQITDCCKKLNIVL